MTCRLALNERGLDITREFLNLLIKRLRLSEPWNFKAPFLISIPYFFLSATAASFREALLSVLCSLFTIIGIAGFGYLSNDLADREYDRKVGRFNGTLGLTILQIILLFIFFLGVALLPWLFYFPVNGVTFGLLVAQFLLFVAYAAPPIRLKDRGFPGLIADALYAHANPAILAAYTFYLLTNRVYENFFWLLLTLGTWQFFLGLRNILQHQILDADHDRSAGSFTYVILRGEKFAIRLMGGVFVPLEILGFITFLGVITLTIPTVAFAWLLYLIVTALIIRMHWKEKLFYPLNDRLYIFMDDFYLKWFPIVVLIELCLHDLWMSILFLLHIIAFRNDLEPLLRKSFHILHSAFVEQKTFK